MPGESDVAENGLPLAWEITRRRLLVGLGLAAGIALAPAGADAAQTATPPPEQEAIDQLIALSSELCGGGTFDPAQAASLLHLLNGDATLGRGLAELQASRLTAAAAGTPAIARAEATPAATRSADAQATAKAILLFWYAGIFNGDPIPDRSSVYTNLLAWQAMYTPAWTTCKLFGAWADPPTLTPQVPQNA